MGSGVGDVVGRIVPFDAVEEEHVAETLRWLGSTDDVYRRVKPDVPARHLVAYVVGAEPLFLTVGGTAGHEDVSLWYVVRGERGKEYRLDPREFGAMRWWDVGRYEVPEADPHFGRFLAKLGAALGVRGFGGP
ncbi:hypothetical protein [Nocardia sp. AG03]|uniref:hypothetical protein n=1 Tax=Nocardia sp. AG03 TaxID=3025312 RepID=UPI00241844E6|nr:hypothetical protein [Nocardia sp. AG03]